jgi:hypothetical protein
MEYLPTDGGFSIIALAKYLQTDKGKIVGTTTAVATLLFILIMTIILWPSESSQQAVISEPDEDDMKNFNEMIEEKRRAEGDVLHGFTEKYEWTQNDTDIEVYYALKGADGNIAAKNVKVDIKPNRLTLLLNGEKVLDGEFYAPVIAGDCNWQLEGSGASKRVWISLYKKEPTTKGKHWRCVFKGDDLFPNKAKVRSHPILCYYNSTCSQNAWMNVHSNFPEGKLMM